MTDQSSLGPVRAGRVGPHRESHEPRLQAHEFLAAGMRPIKGFIEWNGTHNIVNWGMADNARWGCCGFAAWLHYNMAKLVAAGKVVVGTELTTWAPNFHALLPAYWGYGLYKGEVGQPPDQPDQPDQGVDNASMLGWAYKLGFIKGYGEVHDDVFDWFVQTFNGGLIGQALDGPVAQQDFEATPRIPWDTMAKQDGHDTLVIVTHADGSGVEVTWGGLQPYTLGYRLTNWTDRWTIFDEDDPAVNWPLLKEALDEIHGKVTPESIEAARADLSFLVA